MANVVGTVSFRISDKVGGRSIENIGFAVSSETILAILPDLETQSLPVVALNPTPPLEPTFERADWFLVIVGVGDADPYQFDAGVSQVIATSLEIPTGKVADAETGYNITAFDGHPDAIVESSGVYDLKFVERSESFNGYKPVHLDAPIKVFGRICEHRGVCDVAEFSRLVGVHWNWYARFHRRYVHRVSSNSDTGCRTFRTCLPDRIDRVLHVGRVSRLRM